MSYESYDNCNVLFSSNLIQTLSEPRVVHISRMHRHDPNIVGQEKHPKPSNGIRKDVP